MGRSMRPANDLAPGVLPAEATIPVPSSNRVLRVYHDESGWHQSESEAGVFTDDHPLTYVIGSGANGLSFAVQRDHYLFQAPLSFYSKTGKWDLSPGYQLADLGFSRPIAAECALCHSGGPQVIEKLNGEYREPPFRELAIGCENCHGPGGSHVLHPKQPGLMVNPAKMPARLAEEICLNCHQGGDARVLQPGKHYTDFRPGQWLFDTVAIFKAADSLRPEQNADLLEHHAAMKLSRCFRESAGKLSCLTCHDPHVQPAATETAPYFRKKCLTCHTDESCRLALTERTGRTPSDDCVGCHMPKRNVTVISHTALTNHRIPAHPDRATPTENQSNNTDLVLVNAPEGKKTSLPDLTLLQAYGELVHRNPVYQGKYVSLLEHLAETQPKDAYVQAALGHKLLAEGKSQEALTHLSAGLALEETAVNQDMAQALSNLGRAEEALPYLRAAVEKDPYNAALLKTLTLQYINLHRYAEAQEQMRLYVRLFPEDSFMRSLLARVTR
jgi:tetratricopeptide (TPR) repeat protein